MQAAFETIVTGQGGDRKVMVTLAGTSLAQYDAGGPNYAANTDDEVARFALSWFAQELEGALHQHRLRVAARV